MRPSLEDLSKSNVISGLHFSRVQRGCVSAVDNSHMTQRAAKMAKPNVKAVVNRMLMISVPINSKANDPTSIH